MSDAIKKLMYRYDIFLRPLPARRQIALLMRKVRNSLTRRLSPDTLVLGVTYRCQLNCVHCGAAGYEQRKTGELTIDEIKNLFRQARAMGVYHINFTGGEPLLRDDLEPLIADAAQQGLMTSISTNGQMLDQDRIARLKKIGGVSFINVSIDSVRPQTHDSLRGQGGAFERAKEAISQCAAQGLPVFVSTYAVRERIRSGELCELIDWARTQGASGVKILLPIPVGKWLDNSSAMLAAEEKEQVYQLLDPTYVFIEGVGNKCAECNALGRKLLYVSPYGEVQPCGFVPIALGNIRQASLADVWQSINTNIIDKLKNKKDCMMRNKTFRKQYLNGNEQEGVQIVCDCRG